MKKIDKIIEIIRENMVTDSVPTNNISGGDIATFDPLMAFKRRKNGKVDGRGASEKYKKWLRSLRLMK